MHRLYDENLFLKEPRCWCIDVWAVLNNIAETSINEKSLEKENEKSDAKGQIATINSLNEKFPFKKLRILVNSQYLSYKKHGTEN